MQQGGFDFGSGIGVFGRADIGKRGRSGKKGEGGDDTSEDSSLRQ